MPKIGERTASGRIVGQRSSSKNTSSSNLSSAFPQASAAVRASALAEANAVERRSGSRITTTAEAESRRVAAGKEVQRQREIDPTYGTASPALLGQANTPITSQNLGTKPYELPPEPTPPDYSPIVSTALGTVPTVSETPTEQSVMESQRQNFQSMLDELKAPADTASIYNKLERQAQLRQKEQLVSNYQSQLNNIVAARDAQVLGLEGQGRGQTAGFIGGEQARINREAAIQALPIQAQLSAAQGDLEMAKSHVDKMFQIYATDAENKVNYYNSLVKMTYEFQDKQDQRKLDAISKQKDFELQILKSDYERHQRYMDLALENDQMGAFNSLSAIQIPTDPAERLRYNQRINSTISKFGLQSIETKIKQAQLDKLRTEISGDKVDKKTSNAIDKANIVITAVDEAIPMITGYTAGLLGGLSKNVSGTAAYDLAAKIETIKANIGFNELQAMRDASPTGGALGQVAVQELNALQSTIANLNTSQSPEQLKENLLKVKEHYTNWRNTLNGQENNEDIIIEITDY